MVKFLITTRIEWLIVVAVICVAGGIIAFGRGQEPRVGDTRELTVSIVPADKQGLGCAAELPIAGLSCAYASSDVKAVARKLNEAERLAPYVTTKGELVILAGVFASKEVTAEVKHRKRSRDARFQVKCRVKLVSQLAHIPIRFSRRAEFKPADLTWLGRAEECMPDVKDKSKD